MFKNYRYNTFTCHLSYYKIPAHYKLDSLEVKEITLLIFPGEKLLFSHSVMFNSLWPPWTAAWQASLSFTISWSFLKLMSIRSVMPSNDLTLCHPLFSCLQSWPESGSFLMSWLFASGGASASASVLPMNLQDWFPLGWTGLILLIKELSRVFSNTTVQKHQFFTAQPSLWSNSHIHTSC